MPRPDGKGAFAVLYHNAPVGLRVFAFYVHSVVRASSSVHLTFRPPLLYLCPALREYACTLLPCGCAPLPCTCATHPHSRF